MIIGTSVMFFNQKTKIDNVQNWEKTECTVLWRYITNRTYEERPGGLCWRIKYQYQFGRKKYTSTRYSLTEIGHPITNALSMPDKERRKKLKKMEETNSGPYAEGSKQICYVNPHNPQEAFLVLDRPTFLNMLKSFLGQEWLIYFYIITLGIANILYQCGSNKAPDHPDPSEESIGYW